MRSCSAAQSVHVIFLQGYPTLETDAFHGVSIPFLSWLTFLLFFCFQVTSGVLNKSAKEDQERSTHVHEELWLVCCSEECG
jgi:hypothetical protein